MGEAIVHIVIEAAKLVLLVVLEIVAQIVTPYFLIPLSWLVTPPFILIASVFNRGGYRRAVRRRYVGVAQWWLKNV